MQMQKTKKGRREQCVAAECIGHVPDAYCMSLSLMLSPIRRRTHQPAHLVSMSVSMFEENLLIISQLL